MKLVQATFAHFKLGEITDAVRSAGASGATICESMRPVRHGAHQRHFPCLTLETVVHDDLAERVVAALIRTAHGGHPTDGFIVVTPVAAAFGIRTGAIDEAAIAP